ncbi:MAG: hypothetical protein ACE5KT_04680 [Methanosarcinales archaeon]
MQGKEFILFQNFQLFYSIGLYIADDFLIDLKVISKELSEKLSNILADRQRKSLYKKFNMKRFKLRF